LFEKLKTFFHTRSSRYWSQYT